LEGSGNIGSGSAAGYSARKLSTHQKSVLIQVLLTFPGENVGVCFVPSVSDAFAYAEDFVTIFKAINWTAGDAEPTEDLPAAPSGLAIALPSEQLPASAEALRDALRIYHLEAAILNNHAKLCGTRHFVLAVTQA